MVIELIILNLFIILDFIFYYYFLWIKYKSIYIFKNVLIKNILTKYLYVHI